MYHEGVLYHEQLYTVKINELIGSIKFFTWEFCF